MDTLAHRRDDTTPRQKRGRELAKARFEEIRLVRRRTWIVPSESSGYGYLVTTTPETCSCEDAIYGGNVCKHQEAVRFVKAISGECACCEERHRYRDLFEVPEEESSLTWFMGDLLCRDCFDGSDVVL